MRISLQDYCVAHKNTDLITQWHPSKNLPLTPKTISYGSRKKVWWKCPKGHEWQAAVYTRTGNGVDCPACAGKRTVPGENDLASQRPDFVDQWHPTRNGAVTPDSVRPGSHKMVWWICERGHEWRASIKSRTDGAGCPVCANRVLLPGENDLATVNPELAKQWHPEKNGALIPCDFVAGSHKKVWWRCGQGHEWQATVISRTQGGAGCPVCTGKKIVPGTNDLASLFPQISEQWHPNRNGTLTPNAVSPYSNRKVWWLCPLGHSYQAAVGARTNSGSNCPYCAGKKVLPGFNDLATVVPKAAAQWHPTLNGALTPEMVTAGSSKRVWWQCADGHVWQAVIYSRCGAKKVGCPICAGRVRKARYPKKYITPTSKQA